MRLFLFGACVIIVASALVSCSSTLHLSHERWAITAADSGGITGMESGFTLLESGDVFLWSDVRGTQEINYKIGSIPREQANYMKDSIAANLRASATEFVDSPSPSRSHINYMEIEIDENRTRTTWGTPQHPNPPEGLKFWYDNFVQACERMQ